MRLLSTSVLAALLALSSPAMGGEPTPEDRAAARTVAEQGNAAFQEGRYADAIDLFRRAEALLHAPTHLLMIARTQVALGKLVVAKETYLQLLRESLAADAPAAFKKAQADAKAELTALEPRIPTITVQVRGPTGKRAEVTMDGKPVPEALVGVARPVDPGVHLFRATAESVAADEKKVTVGERDRVSVELELRSVGAPRGGASAGVENATTPVTTGGDATDQRGSGALRPLSIGMIGVGVAGIGVGTVFAILASSARSDADDAYARCGDPCPDGPLQEEVRSLDDDASTRSTVAVVSLVAGAALTAGGIALFVASGRRDRGAAGAIAPWVGLGSAGVRGRF